MAGCFYLFGYVGGTEARCCIERGEVYSPYQSIESYDNSTMVAFDSSYDSSTMVDYDCHCW